MVKGYIGVSLPVAILFMLFVAAAGSPVLAQEKVEGVFGSVARVASPSPGLTVITLKTIRKGFQDVESAEATAVRIPGRERGSAVDIAVGDFLAVMGTPITSNSLSAISILVKPESPVVHAHVTGSVVGRAEDRLSLMDRDGNVITADPLLGDRRVNPGQIVTAVVRQDLKAGSLSILAVEAAEAKADRLARAVQRALELGATDNLENLKGRVRPNATGHLTTLQEILNRVDPNIEFLFSDAIESALKGYTEVMANLGLGAPTVRVSGRIESIDRPRGLVVVSPQEGPLVQLKVVAGTALRRFGQNITLENLELAQRVKATYDPGKGDARTIDVVFLPLAKNLVGSLLAQARSGELTGTLDEVQAATVAIRLASGQIVTLKTNEATRIQVREEPAGLSQLVQGDGVKVRYNIATMLALSIDTFDEGQNYVSGVVSSVIPKIRPGIRIPGTAEDGNVSITTPEGEALILNITGGSVIVREGLRRNIGAVTLGALVRPTSRYNPQTREVQRLVLLDPGLKGTVQGRFTTASGRNYVTLATDELDLLTVLVPGKAEFDALAVGQGVVSGLLNPLNQEATQLVVRPPRSIRARGVISELDRDKGILTLTPPKGEPVVILVPNKPGIITVNGAPKSIEDLDVGDEVRFAFYVPETKVAVRIIAAAK